MCSARKLSSLIVRNCRDLPVARRARGVHSSNPWPNTQPHVLHGEDGKLHQLDTVDDLKCWFERRKKEILDDLRTRKTNPHAVFTNSELSLKHIDVYGFDFDCTLVHYTSQVHRLIYELARNRLVEHNDYPAAIKELSFDPHFAIRGLHCDMRNGYLMKIDAYNHIQLSSVHRGHSPVNSDEVFKHYGGTHVPMHVMESVASGSKWKLTQFLDQFSIPEATLFADVLEYLKTQSIRFYPQHLFEDVQRAVFEVHNSKQIHNSICSDLDCYVEGAPRLREFLQRLKSAGKQTFIITNSPFWFVNEGMTHVVGTKDWRDLLDVVVTEARKPSFYSDSTRPFRRLNSDLKTSSWSKVNRLVAGHVYEQGNINDFIRMTNWCGGSVLYFGDHVFTDLAEPLLQHGWKTGAILPELEEEIAHANEEKFKEHLAEVMAVENLLQKRQHFENPAVASLVEEWKGERNDSRRYLKESHNLRFGSVFRTEKSPTYFSRRLASFSNLYTSSLDNLMSYSLDYTFIPRRQALPHEPDLNFDY